MTMKLILIFKLYLAVSILLFLAIFNPPIVPSVSFTVLACVVAFLYSLNNRRLFLEVINHPIVKKFTRMNIILCVYYGFVVLINSGVSNFQEYVSDYISFFIYLALILLVTISFVVYARKNRYDIELILTSFVFAAMIECIFVLVAYFIPPAKDLFLSLMAERLDEARQSSLSWVSEFRNFGLASSLYDIFGYTMSVLSLIAFYKGKRNLIFYIFSLIILFCGVINARTTIILVAFGLLTYYSKTIFHFIALILLVVFVLPFILSSLLSIFSLMGNMDRLLSGIDEISAFVITGEATGYFDALLNRYIFFPSTGLDVLLGEGATPLVAINQGSDIGYIQNIWRFGVIGSLIAYGSYISLFLKCRKFAPRYKRLINANIGMFLLYQIKLSSLGYSQANVVIFIFLFSLIFIPAESDEDKLAINRDYNKA